MQRHNMMSEGAAQAAARQQLRHFQDIIGGWMPTPGKHQRRRRKHQAQVNQGGPIQEKYLTGIIWTDTAIVMICGIRGNDHIFIFTEKH